MALTDAQKRAVAKYNAKSYDEVKIRVSKGKKQLIQEAAEKSNKSVNGYIKDAIAEKIKADTGEDAKL